MDEEKRNRRIVVAIVVIMLLILFIISVLIVIDKNNKEKKVLNLEQKYISENKLITFDKYFMGLRDGRVVSILNLEGNVLYLDDFGIEYDKLFKTNMDTIVFFKKEDDSFKVSIFDGETIINSFEQKVEGDVQEIIYDNLLLGFINSSSDITNIYGLDGSIAELEKISLIPDSKKDNEYIFNSLNSFPAKKDDLYGAIDLSGNVLINFDYEDVKNTSNGYYIVKMNNKYGVISKKKEVIIPITNNYVIDTNDGFVVFNKKIDLYNKKGELITNKKINYKVKDLDIRSNNVSFYDKEYSDLLIVNNKIFILKNKNTELDVEDYYYNEFLVIYRNKKITIYDEFFNKKIDIDIDLDKIKCVYLVENDNYYIEYYKDNKLLRSLINKDVNLSISAELINKTSNYLLYKDKNNIIFKSYDNQVLETISSNDIIINKNSVVLDNVIYYINIK